MLIVLLILAVFWLAYSNGANDNFKGVATLYGSGAASYRTALLWATAATIAGSLLSLLFAGALARAFTGAALVPEDVAGSQALVIAVGMGAALTILAATFLGMPTSTTHALTGALLGVSVLVNGAAAPVGALWSNFLQPLLLSPLIAVLAAAVLYGIFHRVRLATGVERDTCLCFGSELRPVALTQSGAATFAIPANGGPTIMIGREDRCIQRYGGSVVGIDAQSAVTWTHYLSGGSVCFARAVNDTPKIAALMLAGGAAGFKGAGIIIMVTAAMAVGGLLSSRRVAETMSRRITDLNPGQGLTGNLVTAGLVLGASHMGLPVATTHVSVGAITGVGVVSRQARWRTIGQILATWVTTLPLGAALGVAIYCGLRAIEG